MLSRAFCILCLFLLLLASSFAQATNDTINPSHSAIGVFAGANGTAAFQNTAGYTRNTFVSFSYGAFGSFDISRRWRAEASVSYISYGCKYLKTTMQYHQHDTLFAEGQYSTFAGYASGMLLFKYLMNKHNSLILGTRLSKMVKSLTSDYSGYYNKNEFEVTGTREESNYLVQTSPLFSPGVVLGYEYNFNSKVGVSLLFNNDLLPVMKSDRFDKSFVINDYNRSLQFRVSYALFH